VPVSEFFKDLKYLTAYSIPLVLGLSFFLKGPFAYATPLFVFVLVPVLELLLPSNPINLEGPQRLSKAKNFMFDMLLYLNIPVVFGLLFYYFRTFAMGGFTTIELIGFTFSMGIVLGSNGINVAHELGHRTRHWERVLAKTLLCPALYMHFYIEHNYGHHQHAATPNDPATALYNQSIYSFWVSSISGQIKSASVLQKKILKQQNRSGFSLKNDLLWYGLCQTTYLCLVGVVFGPSVVFFAIVVALISVLLLETTNYIEHYGLQRQRRPSGRYEPILETHCWNSNHIMGRILLYELTRHSDHHFRSSKKYQLLDYHKTSPEMPFGYPTSIVLSLLPPLWFFIMNPRIPSEMKP
jgi:alkane 1-monooxygenase